MRKKQISLLIAYLIFFTSLFSFCEIKPIYSEDKAEYIIISEDQYLESTKSWRNFLIEELGKTVLSFPISELFKSSDNELEKCKLLKDFIKDSYDLKGAHYFLLVGSQIPYMKLYPDGLNSKLLKVPYIYSDLFFSDFSSKWDFDGDGIYGEIDDDRIQLKPEVRIGRLPFSSQETIENYFKRAISSYIGEKNNSALFAASFQQFEHMVSNKYESKIDNADFCENIIKDIDKSYNCYRLYESDGIQSSKWIYKSDCCLSKSSINNYLVDTNPLIACFNLKGDAKSLFKTYWTKDINKNSLADTEEVKDEIVFDGASALDVSSNTFFFSVQAPSLWQEGNNNLSIDVLSKTGLIFGGNSIDISELDPSSEINYEILSFWLKEIFNKTEIGEALNNTISKYSEFYKNSKQTDKVKVVSALYSLSFIGDSMLSLDGKNQIKNNKYRYTSYLINETLINSTEKKEIKNREVLPNPPSLEKVELNRKIFSIDPIEFSKSHNGNGFYCTKDGGIVIASSIPVRNGYRFCVLKYKSDGSKEWEYIPNMKAEGGKSETGYGAAFDIIERREFEGYIAVGFLEQQDSGGNKDKDVCIIVLDNNGVELYRSKYGTLSQNKCRGHCDDCALNIVPLKSGEYIVSGYQMSDGLTYSLYIATLFPNGGIKNQYNRAVVINNLGEQIYSGPQPYTRIKQIDENYILMYVEKYNTLILTNNNFEEAIMKVFFPFDKYNFPDMVYFEKKDNRVSSELKGKMIFCYENSLFSLEVSGEQDTEGKITPIKSFPGCFKCLNIFKQDNGVYLLCKVDNSSFYLIKFDFMLNFLWKIDLHETLQQKSYNPYYSSYFFETFSPKLEILEDNRIKLNQILANWLKNSVSTNDYSLIDCTFEIPYELRKPKLNVAAKTFYSLSPILIGNKVYFSFRISNIGGGKIDIQLNPDSPDMVAEVYPQKLSCSQSEDCLLLVDLSNYKIGKYERSIDILNKNNPNDHSILKILFEIKDLEPLLEISTDVVDFGTIKEGEIIDKNIIFSNKGGGNINLKLITDQDWVNVDPIEITIGKNDEKQVKVTTKFKNEMDGEFESSIRVYSNNEFLKSIMIKINFLHSKPVISIFSNDENFDTGNKFEFGKINISDFIKGSFSIKNAGTGTLTGTIVNKNEILDLKPIGSFSLKESESIEISFMIDCRILKPDIYDISISIESNDKNEEIYFHWIVLPPMPEFEPKSFNIEKVIQNRKIELVVKIKNIIGNVKMIVNTNTFWISLPEQEITINSNQDYKFKIDTNELPIGKHFGEIYFSFVFVPSELDYIELGKFKLPIEINVEPDKLVIELWIGKNKALVNGVPKNIDPDDLSITPMIVNNITMVPLRFVGENLGAIVQWNNSEQSIYLNFADRKLEIRLFVNKKYAYVNGKKYELQTPPIIIKSRVFVPIRFISEAIGAKVDWNSKQQKITITCLNE